MYTSSRSEYSGASSTRASTSDPALSDGSRAGGRHGNNPRPADFRLPSPPDDRHAALGRRPPRPGAPTPRRPACTTCTTSRNAYVPLVGEARRLGRPRRALLVKVRARIRRV